MSVRIDTPLLSIVIPTRNRQEYALSAVESTLRIQDPGLEHMVDLRCSALQYVVLVETAVVEDRVDLENRRIDLCHSFSQ